MMPKKMLSKTLFLVSYLFLCATAFAQDEIQWDGKYQLQLSDFKSASTQIGGTTVYSLQTFLGVDFSFSMSRVQFMMTKNFNAKVNNNFRRNVASLVAPDTASAENLVAFAQYQFDTAELYARKFRKKIFEEKGTFSDVSFFKPFYDDIQKEFSERVADAVKKTDLGRKKEELGVLHAAVLKEVGELEDFCRQCETKKKY
ncbi:hypothetical protein [Flavobacterium silvaticum]|uniref:DUF4142 domain-containing protein n=1 Tax=Flavobacterium silvaticum TaxID=1852020 RepID=A0A972JJV3_9FLAO|nr:hypothetical protein [Flavobacterium silvaticum]NMH28482.1 hypothetical protein [Flavobacterium silvaticum]